MQEGNFVCNDKNEGRKHIKHQAIVHATRESTPQNTVISTSTKSAPIITQFLVQNKIKHHRTKGKHQLKAFSNKSNARNRANFHAKAFKLRMQTRSEPGQRCSTEKIRTIKIFVLKKFTKFWFWIFSVLAPLARFTSGLHSQFKCFCVKVCSVSCIAFV